MSYMDNAQSSLMIQQLRAIKDSNDNIVRKSDVLGLLNAIKQITFSFESQIFEPHAIHDTMKQFYTYHQG